jgi:hypothetical protein
MEFATGVLHWSPKVFWRSTMCELMAANKGYLRVMKLTNENAVTPDELGKLKEAAQARQTKPRRMKGC